jgi:predicted RNA methylase
MRVAKVFTDADIIARISAAVLRNGGRIRVLDAGCGPGILKVALAPLVDEVVRDGVEVDLEPATVALYPSPYFGGLGLLRPVGVGHGSIFLVILYKRVA